MLGNRVLKMREGLAAPVSKLVPKTVSEANMKVRAQHCIVPAAGRVFSQLVVLSVAVAMSRSFAHARHCDVSHPFGAMLQVLRKHLETTSYTSGGASSQKPQRGRDQGRSRGRV